MAHIWTVRYFYGAFLVILKLDRPSPHSLLLYYNENSGYASTEKRKSNGFKITFFELIMTDFSFLSE